MRIKLLASVATMATIAFDNSHMTSQTCETVIIKGANGEPARVNKSDYDADQGEGGEKAMTLWKGDEPDLSEPLGNIDPATIARVPTPSTPNMMKGPDEPITAANVPNSAPAAGTDPATGAPIPAEQLLVAKKGSGAKARYHVVNATSGEATTREGIDTNGYETEAAAWQAVMTVNGSPAPAA